MNLNWQCFTKNDQIFCSARLPNKRYFASADKGSTDMDVICCVYASWCGHCHSLMEKCQPNWDKISQNNGKVYNIKGKPCKIYILDGEKDQAMVQQMGINISGYPSLFRNFIIDQAGNKVYNGKMNLWQTAKCRDEFANLVNSI